MRILGIDPGIATIGFGLVEAERGQVHMLRYGAVTTPAGLPLSRRLYQIETDMEALLQVSDIRFKHYSKGSLPAVTWLEVERLVDPGILVAVEATLELP